MLGIAHVVLAVLSIALGFGLAAVTLAGEVAKGPSPTGGQAATAYVIGGFLIGGLIGALGQWVQRLRETRQGRATSAPPAGGGR